MQIHFLVTWRRVYLTTAVWTQRGMGWLVVTHPAFVYIDPLNKAHLGRRGNTPEVADRSSGLASCAIVGVSSRERPSKKQASTRKQPPAVWYPTAHACTTSNNYEFSRPEIEPWHEAITINQSINQQAKQQKHVPGAEFQKEFKKFKIKLN